MRNLGTLAYMPLAISLLSMNTAHANVEQDALDLIANFADRFCSEISLEGETVDSEFIAKANGELSSLMRYLADIGIEGAVSVAKSTYSGIDQTNLVEILKSNMDCRLTIWKDLRALVGAREIKEENKKIEELIDVEISRKDDIFRFNRFCAKVSNLGEINLKCGGSNHCDIEFKAGEKLEEMSFYVSNTILMLDKRNYGVDFRCELGECLEFTQMHNGEKMDEYGGDFYSVDFGSNNYECAEFLVDMFK